MTGPVTTTTISGNETDGEDETGTPGDMPGCDPLADPLAECGASMACDLTSKTCVPALGTGLEDDLCAGTEECSPGLVCASGRCRALCDALLGEGCAAERVCAAAAEPLPGLCLTSCTLALNDCVLPGDACKRVVGAGGQVYAACLVNSGFGLTGDACFADPECTTGFLCTPAADHTLPCTNQAASCCAPICDSFELPCFGIEPICIELDIPGQESSGYCGDG